MIRFRLTPEQHNRLSSMVKGMTSKQRPEMIEHIRLDYEGGRLTFTLCDGYVMSTYKIPHIDHEGASTLEAPYYYLPAEIVKKRRGIKSGDEVIEIDGSTLIITEYGGSSTRTTREHIPGERGLTWDQAYRPSAYSDTRKIRLDASKLRALLELYTGDFIDLALPESDSAPIWVYSQDEEHDRNSILMPVRK